MKQESSNHITDEDLERYSVAVRQLGTMLAEIEEHLLVCKLCRARCEDIDARVETMKNTQRLIEARERQRPTED